MGFAYNFLSIFVEVVKSPKIQVRHDGKNYLLPRPLAIVNMRLYHKNELYTEGKGFFFITIGPWLLGACSAHISEFTTSENVHSSQRSKST